MSDPQVPNDSVDTPDVPADDAVTDAPGDAADTGAAPVAETVAEPAEVKSEAATDATSGPAADPDLAAFEEAEREHPGTFSAPDLSYLDDVQPAKAEEPEELEVQVPAVAAEAYEAETEVDVPTIVASEPAPSLGPIFVQAPEAPRDRGNRATIGLIGLLATVSFAILFWATNLGLVGLSGQLTNENIVEAMLAPLTTFGFWLPVVIFYIGFWLLGVFINRGRWGYWVVFGIIVGVVSYGGYALGQLVEAPFWYQTPSEAAATVGEALTAPLALASFVFGRELTVWFGAWAAKSGARKTEKNLEAQAEYDRIIEAGPQLDS